MIVEQLEPEPSGLASMVGDLIEQNLARDPARKRLLRRALVAIEATDAGVGISVSMDPEHVAVGGRLSPDAPADLTVEASSLELLALIDAPLRFGVADPFDRAGRRALAGVMRGRIRLRPLVRSFATARRFTMLLSTR